MAELGSAAVAWLERWEREFASRWEPTESGSGLEPSIDVTFPRHLQVVVDLQVEVEKETARAKAQSLKPKADEPGES